MHAWTLLQMVRTDAVSKRSLNQYILPVGAGSILEALDAGKHVIVAINESLMGNHQTELAEQLAKDKHLVHTTPK